MQFFHSSIFPRFIFGSWSSAAVELSVSSSNFFFLISPEAFFATGSTDFLTGSPKFLTGSLTDSTKFLTVSMFSWSEKWAEHLGNGKKLNPNLSLRCRSTSLTVKLICIIQKKFFPDPPTGLILRVELINFDRFDRGVGTARVCYGWNFVRFFFEEHLRIIGGLLFTAECRSSSNFGKFFFDISANGIDRFRRSFFVGGCTCRSRNFLIGRLRINFNFFSIPADTRRISSRYCGTSESSGRRLVTQF